MPVPVPADHRERVRQLAAALATSRGPVRLRKHTGLGHVLAVDAAARLAEVEGMTTYADLVDATLPHGLAPAVVPELRSITVGGAVTGVGIESSSFRYGLVHETVEAFDVLAADGHVRHCSPAEHTDLYYGFPNPTSTTASRTRTAAWDTRRGSRCGSCRSRPS